MKQSKVDWVRQNNSSGIRASDWSAIGLITIAAAVLAPVSVGRGQSAAPSPANAKASADAMASSDPTFGRAARDLHAGTRLLVTKLPTDTNSNLCIVPLQMTVLAALVAMHGDAAARARLGRQWFAGARGLEDGLRALGGLVRELEVLEGADFRFGGRLHAKPEAGLERELLGQLEAAVHVHAATFGRGEDLAALAASLSAFVESTTAGLVRGAVRGEDLRPDLTCVLVQAFALRADWLRPFDAASKEVGRFLVAEKRFVRCTTMHQRLTALHAVGDDAEVVRLGLTGDLVVDFVRPNTIESLGALLPRLALLLDGEWAPLRALAPTDLELSLTMFDVPSRLDVLDHLCATLLEPTDSAPSDAPVARRPLPLWAQQSARITIDERGLQVGSAAEFYGGPSVADPGPRRLRLDQPFVFAIRDLRTGIVLAAGCIVNPSPDEEIQDW
jgi:hypothetical protein